MSGKVAVNQELELGRGLKDDILVIRAYCGHCHEHVMPRDDGRCGWCKTEIVDEHALPAKEILARLEHEMTITYPAGLEKASAVKTPARPPQGPHPRERQPDDAGVFSSSAGRPATEGTEPMTEDRLPRGELLRLVLAEVDAGRRTAAAIAPRVGRTPSNVSAALAKLARKDLAEKGSRGIFEVTAAGKEALATGEGFDSATTPAKPAPAAPAPEPEPEPEPELPTAIETNRQPLVDDILYGFFHDPAALEDEAEFLRRRADAIDNVAAGIRQLQELDQAA